MATIVLEEDERQLGIARFTQRAQHQIQSTRPAPNTLTQREQKIWTERSR
jgi:hypothetical protein